MTPEDLMDEITLETREDLRRLVEEDYSWRPLTKLMLWGEQDNWPGFSLHVKMRVQDTYAPDPRFLLDVNHRRPLPVRLPVPEEVAILAIRHQLHAIDFHESDEWIRVRGEMLFNPHRKGL